MIETKISSFLTHHNTQKQGLTAMSNIVKSAIVDANTVKKTVEDRAKDMFLKEFSPAVKQMLANVINEQVSAGNDQPGGYAPETDQDKIGVGANKSASDINDGTGDGPEKLKEEGDLDVEPDEDDFGSTDEDVPSEKSSKAGSSFDPTSPIPVTDEGEEDELGLDDEEPVIEELPPATDDDELGLGSEMGDEEEEDEAVLELVAGETEPEGDEEPNVAKMGSLPESEEEEEEEEEEDESKKLREYKKALKLYKRQNKILKEAVAVLRNKFRKIDLFNAKLAYAFKLMHTPGLTRNEKKQIAESFDRARTVRETKIIYATMKKALETASRKKVAPKSGNIRSVISESTKTQQAQSNRMTELAGL